MASDLLSYALNIEFALQDKASPQLDLVDQRLGKVEQQVSNIATKTMVSMQTITTQLNTTLIQMATQYEKINQSSLAGVKPLKDSSTLNTAAQKNLTLEANMLKDQVLKTWIDITKILEVKAKQLTEESKIIEKEKDQVKQVEKEFGMWSRQIELATKALMAHIRGLFDINAAVLEAVRATEAFKNANYRLYGSQTELVARANQLSLQYGIMREQAMQAVAALGNLKVPTEMLDKLVETTVKFNRLSNVSIGQTAAWQKNLVAMGSSTAEIERRMTHMAIAMRRFGLDTSDVTSIMRTQEEQAQRLRQMYGAKMTGEMQRAQVAVAAFAKELGATPQVAQQAAAALGTVQPHHLQLLGASAGVTADQMETAEGQTKAMAIASSNLAQELRNAQGPYGRITVLLKAQGMYGDQLGESLVNLAEQQNASNSTVRNGADAQRLMADALNGHINEVDNLNGIYQESNQTIVAQLGLLKNAFFATIGAIWSKIEPAVIVFLQWLNTIIYGIGRVITKVGAWLDSLGPVGTTIKYIAATIMIAVVAFVILNAVLSAFGVAARVAGGAGSAMGSMIQRVLEGMARGLQALAAHQVTMLTLSVLLLAMGAGAFLFALGVAKIAEHGVAGIKALLGLATAVVIMALGLAFAGQIAQASAVGLLAVAVVLLAAGFAAYMLALAVQMLVNVGAGAMGVLITLAIVLVVLGLALVGLAMLAMPVLPALFAVAAVIFIVAVAAVILALAFSIAVETLSRLNVDLALNILGFGLVMIAASAVLIIAGILLIIAAALLLVAGIVLAVAAILIFASALLIGLGGAILFAGAVFIMMAAGLLALAAPLLIIGAILLIVAAPILIIAAVVLIPAAIALLIAGTLLLVAAVLIGAAGLLILIGGVGVYLGGTLLLMGAPLLNQASGPLIKAAFWLCIAAPFLLAAALLLAPIGVLLLVAGLGIFLGGLFMFLGAFLLITGATMLVLSAVFLVAAGIALIIAAPLLLVGALLLLPAAIMLLVISVIMLIPAVVLAVVGILLLIAGIGILLGGMMIRAGAWFLLGSGAMLMEAAPGLLGGALLMVPAAILLLIAGVLLLVAAIPFAAGAALLLVGGAIFLVASILLAIGAVFFEVAASTICPWAPEFLGASIMLLAAGMLLILAAGSIMAGGALMVPAAAVLLVAGMMLRFMSGPIISAANKLEPTGQKLFEIGMGFLMAGIGLYVGGGMMRASVSILRAAGKELGGMAAELATDLEPMEAVAALASRVAFPMLILGMAVYHGAMKLFFGALWLKAATDALQVPTLALFFQGVVLLAATALVLAAADQLLTGATKMVEASQLIIRAAFGFFVLALVANLVYDGSLKLVKSAYWLGLAAMLMDAPAMKLWLAGKQIHAGAEWLDKAGALLNSGADTLLAAAEKITQSVAGYQSLYVISLLVGSSSSRLVWSAFVLHYAATLLESAALSLTKSALILIVGSGLLWFASKWLLAAASNIYVSADLITNSVHLVWSLAVIAAGVLVGATGLAVGASRLGLAASALLGPAFTICFALWLLSAAAFQFADAMAGLRLALMEPLGILLTVFAVGARSAALELFEALDFILMRIETYGERMTTNALRIAHAFRGIMPSLPVGIAGLNLISAQSFTTTRTKDSSEVFAERNQRQDERQKQQQMINKLDQIVTTLQRLDTTVKSVAGGGAGGALQTTVGEIAQLLRDHLPDMARNQSPGLAHALSEWMR